MASKISKMINYSLKKLVQGYFSPHLNVGKLRSDDFQKPSPMARKHCRTEEFRLDDIRGSWLFPLKKKSDTIILYFHGGAYVCGPSLLQWRMLSHMCRESGYSALMINYSCAPEHPYPAAIEEMEKVYDFLSLSINREHIVFMGDSAGGGLALGLTMKLRDQSKSLPGKLVLLSPWLDVSMENEGISDQILLDNMLALPGLKEAAQMYCGRENNRNSYISPIWGDLKGLPPIYLMIGTHDLLLPDCRKLYKRALEDQIQIKYEEWDEMFHVWMLNIPYLPEANDAVKNIIRWI